MDAYEIDNIIEKELERLEREHIPDKLIFQKFLNIRTSVNLKGGKNENRLGFK